MKKRKNAAERPSVQVYIAELVRGYGNKQVVHYRVEVVGECLQDTAVRQLVLVVIQRALENNGLAVLGG